MSIAPQRSEQPQWLTPSQLHAWRELATLMTRLPAALEAQLKREAGLSFLEYYVMAGLSDQPDHAMRLSELADRAHSELSRLSHLVARLERRGFVQRVTDCDDGRFTKAVLTEAGLAHMVKVAPAHVEEVRRLVFAVLDDAEVEALDATARKINDGLR
ncbi:MarR family transcriptional regulator [Streptomyces sp. NPDC051976]|uniref:MarR family winged helix-turn-helix transcriptional regulator n=1 Tax=Streptomyces sp. NPDC051976 TaxID=3154947 RepID=UPI0034315F9B